MIKTTNLIREHLKPRPNVRNGSKVDSLAHLVFRWKRVSNASRARSSAHGATLLPPNRLLESPAYRSAHMHAFIIEDEYLIGRSLQDMLEQLGFTKFSFARSEDVAVFTATAPRKIDLITADVRLLPGDGVRAVEAICAKREIPVIFITGYAEELEERTPAATVIQKPVKQEELATAVRKVLSGQRQTC